MLLLMCHLNISDKTTSHNCGARNSDAVIKQYRQKAKRRWQELRITNTS